MLHVHQSGIGSCRKRERGFQASHGSDTFGANEEQRSERPFKRQRSSVDIHAQAATSMLLTSTSQPLSGRVLAKQVSAKHAQDAH